jgi:hypothetical protein
MKKTCTGCNDLRREAAKPGVDMRQLLVDVLMHEMSRECRDAKPPVTRGK